MNAIVRKALHAYGAQSLETEVAAASPHRLILMLYDGAIKAVNMAKAYMQNGQIAEKGAAISKAIAIIDEGLRLSLDKERGGELVHNLDALYAYMTQQLLLANIHNQVDTLDEVCGLLASLKEAWESIGSQVGSSASNVEQPQRVLSGRV